MVEAAAPGTQMAIRARPLSGRPLLSLATLGLKTVVIEMPLAMGPIAVRHAALHVCMAR